MRALLSGSAFAHFRENAHSGRSWYHKGKSDGRAIGKGNYCIFGYNSIIYAEIIYDLDWIQIGDEMYLVDTDTNRTRYCYIVTEYIIVEPNQIEVLNDYGELFFM